MRRIGIVRDEGGNIMILFALAFFVVAGAAGLAIDTVRTKRVSDRVQHASDAAVLAAVRHAAQQTAQGGDTAAIIAEAEGVGQAHWSSNLDRLDDALTPPSIALEQTGQGWRARIETRGSVKTTLGAVMGISTLSYGIQAEATSEAGTPYMDFYLLLDTSQSMGLAATQDATDRMIAATGCQFGCHVTGQASSYEWARANAVPMRIDVLRTATDKLIQKAQDTASVSNQFRIGLWTFDKTVTKLSDLETSYATVRSAASRVDLPTYEDGTQTDDALKELSNVATQSGSGRGADNPVKFLFLVTDGVQDGFYTGWMPPIGLRTSVPGYGIGSESPVSPTACDDIKAKGVTIAVLYTTYVPFPGWWQYDALIGPFASDIAANLKACASPGFFFEASDGPDIDAAMQKMFAAAVAFGSGPRITK